MPQRRNHTVFVGRRTEVPREEFHRICPSVENEDAGMFDPEDENMLDDCDHEQPEDTSSIMARVDADDLSPMSASEIFEASITATHREEPLAFGARRQLRPRPPKNTLQRLNEIKIHPTKPAIARKARRKTTKTSQTEFSGKSNEWEVEAIVDSMIEAETLKHWYRVKWKGFSSESNTWEPKKNLVNCRALVEAYEKRAEKKKA